MGARTSFLKPPHVSMGLPFCFFCRSEITLRDRPTTQSFAIPNSIRSRETGLPITCALWAPKVTLVRVRAMSASLLTFCAGIVHPVHPGQSLAEPTVLVRPNSVLCRQQLLSVIWFGYFHVLVCYFESGSTHFQKLGKFSLGAEEYIHSYKADKTNH